MVTPQVHGIVGKSGTENIYGHPQIFTVWRTLSFVEVGNILDIGPGPVQNLMTLQAVAAVAVGQSH